MSSLDGLTRAKMEAALPLDVETVERRNLAFLSKHGLRVRPMEDRELAAVLVADGAIYATSAPARIDTVREWCAKVPDWGFVIEASGEPQTAPSQEAAAGGSCGGAAASSGNGVSSGTTSSRPGAPAAPGSGDTGGGGWAPLGVCIMIPLSAAGWQALTSGELQESDMRDGGNVSSGHCYCSGGAAASCSSGCSGSAAAAAAAVAAAPLCHDSRGSQVSVSPCGCAGAHPVSGGAAPAPGTSTGTGQLHHQVPHHQSRRPGLLHDPDAPGHDGGCMGLHIYHMERAPAYSPHLPTFGLVALYGIALGLCASQRVRRRAGQPGPLRLIGMSGLAVSPTGISLTSVLYGSREQGYISNEFVLRVPPARQSAPPQALHTPPHRQQQQEPQRPQAAVQQQGSGGRCSEQGGGSGSGSGSGFGGDAGEDGGRSSSWSLDGDGGGSGDGSSGEGGGSDALSCVLNGTASLVGKRKLEVHALRTQEELDALLQAGYEFVARCRMTLQYTHEPSLVWTIVPRALDGPAAAAAAAVASAAGAASPPGPAAVARRPESGPLLARL